MNRKTRLTILEPNAVPRADYQAVMQAAEVYETKVASSIKPEDALLAKLLLDIDEYIGALRNEYPELSAIEFVNQTEAQKAILARILHDEGNPSLRIAAKLLWVLAEDGPVAQQKL